MIRKYYQDRQEAIEYLYVMLDGHRSQYQLEVLNQITHETSIAKIYELGDIAYDKPNPGLKSISRDTAKRYVQLFGGRLTGCINEPTSYPTLINNFGDRIGIVME